MKPLLFISVSIAIAALATFFVGSRQTGGLFDLSALRSDAPVIVAVGLLSSLTLGFGTLFAEAMFENFQHSPLTRALQAGTSFGLAWLAFEPWFVSLPNV